MPQLSLFGNQYRRHRQRTPAVGFAKLYILSLPKMASNAEESSLRAGANPTA